MIYSFLISFMILQADDWFTVAVRPVLIAQGVIGIIALIGFYAILRRFLNNEFPAAMQNVNTRLDTLHEDFKELEVDFRRSLLEVERLKERVENLSYRQEMLDRKQDRQDSSKVLDDTQTRRRRLNDPK